MEKIYNIRNNLLLLILLIFLILNFTVAAFGAERGKTSIHTSVWKQNLLENLPRDFCDPISFFRNCYDVSDEQCLSASSKSVKECLVQFQLPNKINPYGNGIQYAYRIGLCSGKNFDTKLKEFRKESEEKCTHASLN